MLQKNDQVINQDPGVVALSHREFLKIHKDYEKAAKVMSLVYVSASDKGIERIKKGSRFVYIHNSRPVTNKAQLERIKKLAIPPAWTNVWICALENGHIQATGFDLRNRKQYRYHELWNKLRAETKYHRLYEFGKALPGIRQKVQQDFAKRELTVEKVLALVVMLMERTYIRIGSSEYQKLYGSYGLSTLNDKHVRIEGSVMNFCFRGKKGIDHQVTIKNQKLAKAVRACREIPGKELFQYYSDNKERRSIDSGMVNEYIRNAGGRLDFTAKDFRTWAGSLNLLWAFKSIGDAVTATESKKNILEALDQVSKKLGNTRTVCRKYYVHPGLISMYEENKLKAYLEWLDKLEEPEDHEGLTGSEQVLMRILKSLQT